MNVTTHDIEANGQRFILQWTHDETGDNKGYIMITEACDEPDEVCMHEAYDFAEVA